MSPTFLRDSSLFNALQIIAYASLFSSFVVTDWQPDSFNPRARSYGMRLVAGSIFSGNGGYRFNFLVNLVFELNFSTGEGVFDSRAIRPAIQRSQVAAVLGFQFLYVIGKVVQFPRTLRALSISYYCFHFPFRTATRPPRS